MVAEKGLLDTLLIGGDGPEAAATFLRAARRLAPHGQLLSVSDLPSDMRQDLCADVLPSPATHQDRAPLKVGEIVLCTFGSNLGPWWPCQNWGC